MASSLSLPHLHFLASTSSSLLPIRSSKAEGPLRRPSAPVKEASPPLPRPSLDPSSPPSPTSPPPPRPFYPSVTIEFQRQRAKELQQYFLDRTYEQRAAQGRIFGWTIPNEINNGRWAMFGIAVGLLTEYATGADFVDQMKIIISNFGIADVD